MPDVTAADLKLDPETEARVQRLAAARQQSAERVMRDAVEQYVEREETREQWRQEALAAWANYQATGLYLTGDEADAWLARLEAGEDVDPPACHV